MTANPPPMRFFVDQCVPDSVGRTLREAGYETILLREKIATNSPDTLVAAIAEANNAILVTMDSDFKKIASQYGIGQSRFRKLSLIQFSKCQSPRLQTVLVKPCPFLSTNGCSQRISSQDVCSS